MKKITLFLIISWIALIGLFLLNICCLPDPGVLTDMSYSNLKAISVRELQRKIIQRDIEHFREMKSFYGLNRLYGFLIDPGSKDLILFGEADTAKPNLHFDDFVVSLRNTYCLYCPLEGNTQYYSDPSVTIDPDPQTMNLLTNLNNGDTGDDPGMKAREWQELCREPQKLGVFGIPFKSHLAAVMLEADYLMKDVANGNYPVEIQKDFKSLHQLRKDLVEESFKSGKEINLGSPLNRFEFIGPEAFFKNSENIYFHYSQPIVLITEEEYIAGNSFSGTGRADPLARKFTGNFTKKYPEISKEISIYQTLTESYRIFAIAQAIRESNFVMDTTFFKILFHYYPLDEYNVPASLPGRSMVDLVSYSTDKGLSTYYLYSCGGVNLATKTRKSMVNKMKGAEIMNSIIMSRPTSDAVQWDVSNSEKGSWVLYINGLGLILK